MRRPDNVKTMPAVGKTPKRAPTPGAVAIDNLSIVRRMLQQFGAVNDKGLKGTVGDFIRLVALEKELRTNAEVREIRVQWIESLPPEFEN